MKPPVVRPISYVAVLLQFGIGIGLAAIIEFTFDLDHLSYAFFFAAVVHAIAYRVARRAFASDHRRGIELIRAGKFAEAVPFFEASYEAFSRRPGLDRFRSVTLGSASAMSYREMALCNAAFCYGQLGNGARAVSLYEQALREFPECGMAESALKLLRSVQLCGHPPNS